MPWPNFGGEADDVIYCGPYPPEFADMQRAYPGLGCESYVYMWETGYRPAPATDPADDITDIIEGGIGNTLRRGTRIITAPLRGGWSSAIGWVVGLIIGYFVLKAIASIFGISGTGTATNFTKSKGSWLF